MKVQKGPECQEPLPLQLQTEDGLGSQKGKPKRKATVFLRDRSTVSRDVTEGKGWEMKEKGDPGKRTCICGNFVGVFGRSRNQARGEQAHKH